MKYTNERSGIIILICMWIMVTIGCILNIKASTELIGVYILLAFGLIITIIYIPTFIKTLKIKKEYENIIANGIKIQGRIVNCNFNTYTIGDDRTWNYSVVVTYFEPYTNKEKSITTPPLSFNPIRSLGDTTCSVYILNEKYYVTDFVPKKRTRQYMVW